jgi:hypothetical protein
MTSDEALEVIRAQAGSTLHFGTVEKLAAILPEWEEIVANDSSLRPPPNARSKDAGARIRR